MRRAALLLGLTTLFSCAQPGLPTELIVEVRSDLQPAELTHLHVSFLDGAGREENPAHDFALKPGLPISFSLVPTNGVDEFRLVVTGQKAEADGTRATVIERSENLAFQVHARRWLVIYLRASCTRQLCTAGQDVQTCESGSCVPIPAAILLDHPPEPETGSMEDPAMTADASMPRVGHDAGQLDATLDAGSTRCADDDVCCNGVANEGCGCLHGATTTCGLRVSGLEACVASATITCAGGTWPTASCSGTCNDCPAGACANGSCVDDFDSYHCSCATGFAPSADEKACVDIDDCKPGACAHGKCIDGIHDFTCSCDTGFVGTGTRACACGNLPSTGGTPTECAGGRQLRLPVSLNVDSIDNFWVVAGDLDKDCNDDVVLEETSAARRLLLLRGRGDGTFFEPQTLATGVTEPVLADVDQDGLNDIVVSGFGGTASLAVVRNQGGGAFGAAVSLTTGVPGGSLGLAVGDVDGDGRLEAVTGSDAWTATTNNAAILSGLDVRGTAASSKFFSLGAVKMWSAAVADLDHSGGLDVVFDRFGNEGGLTVYLSSASGLGAASPYSISGYPITVRAGDVDGDGWNDLVAGLWATGEVAVLTNQRNGTFAAAVRTGLAYSGCNASAGCLWNLALPDLNADGRADIVVPGFNDNRLSVLLSNNGSFAVTESYAIGPIGTQPRAVGFGDFNRDGKRDVIVTSANAPPVLLSHCP